MDQDTAFETETEALFFFLISFVNSPFKNSTPAVFMDSQTLAHRVNSCRLNLNSAWRGGLCFKAVYIDRVHNHLADHLAKEGRSRGSMTSAWLT